MCIPKRDIAASVLVAAAWLLYMLWAIEASPPGLNGTRATGVVVLGLGFAASASAVVPGFDKLMRGNRVYVVATSLIGLVALAGALQMLLDKSRFGLGLLMSAMAALWLIATIHHVLLARGRAQVVRPVDAGADPGTGTDGLNR